MKEEIEEHRRDMITANKRKRKTEYNEKDKEVKRSSRADRRKWVNALTRKAEEAVRNGNLKGVYEVTKTNEHGESPYSREQAQME